MSNPATPDRAAQPCADDHLTPLDVMLATMRWGHEQLASGRLSAVDKDKEAADQLDAEIALRQLALDAAIAAAEYLPPAWSPAKHR